MSAKQRRTRPTGLAKPKRSLREEYRSLMAKRPLLPADIRRLEILMTLLMHQEAQNASK